MKTLLHVKGQEQLRQATLIAFYGPKPPEFEQFLLKCQDVIHETMGIDFRPYDIEQIHATIIGMERASGDELVNKNMSRYRGKHVAMDIVGFARYLQASPQFPLRLQFGGFAPGDESFTSQGRCPYDRSFSIQGDKAVLIGWPVPVPTSGQRRAHKLVNCVGVDVDQSLDSIRKHAQSFNILHTYHTSEKDVDNDLYLRLGKINESSSNDTRIVELNHKVRAWLAQSPLILDLVCQDLMVASYQDEMLPIHSTQQISIDSICHQRVEVTSLFT